MQELTAVLSRLQVQLDAWLNAKTKLFDGSTWFGGASAAAHTKVLTHVNQMQSIERQLQSAITFHMNGFHTILSAKTDIINICNAAQAAIDEVNRQTFEDESERDNAIQKIVDTALQSNTGVVSAAGTAIASGQVYSPIWGTDAAPSFANTSTGDSDAGSGSTPPSGASLPAGQIQNVVSGPTANAQEPANNGVANPDVGASGTTAAPSESTQASGWNSNTVGGGGGGATATQSGSNAAAAHSGATQEQGYIQNAIGGSGGAAPAPQPTPSSVSAGALGGAPAPAPPSGRAPSMGEERVLQGPVLAAPVPAVVAVRRHPLPRPARLRVRRAAARASRPSVTQSPTVHRARAGANRPRALGNRTLTRWRRR